MQAQFDEKGAAAHLDVGADLSGGGTQIRSSRFGKGICAHKVLLNKAYLINPRHELVIIL